MSSLLNTLMKLTLPNQWTPTAELYPKLRCLRSVILDVSLLVVVHIY